MGWLLLARSYTLDQGLRDLPIGDRLRFGPGSGLEAGVGESGEHPSAI
jgi:hypothetical protein